MLTAREDTNNKIVFNAPAYSPAEIPTQKKSDITYLRLSNTLNGSTILELDIYLEHNDTGEEFFIIRDLTMLSGTSVEFQDDEIFLLPEHTLKVRTNWPNGFTAIYKLK